MLTNTVALPEHTKIATTACHVVVCAHRPKGASAGGVSWLEFHTTSTKGFPVTCGQGAKSADNKPLFSAGRAATLGEQCDSLTGSQLFDAR